MNLRIARAREQDIPAIFDLVRQLAEYEKLSHAVAATQNNLKIALFSAEPAARALLAFVDDAPAGAGYILL